MTNDLRLVLVLSASLALGVMACGGSSATSVLNNPSVVTDMVTLTDSMYNDSLWQVPLGDGPVGVFQARVATIPLPAITQGIANNGLVLVYVNTDTATDSAAVWTPLPYSVAFNYLQTFTYGYSVGQMKIGFYTATTDVDFGAPDVYLMTVPTAQFKVVVADGSAESLFDDRRGSP